MILSIRRLIPNMLGCFSSSVHFVTNIDGSTHQGRRMSEAKCEDIVWMDLEMTGLDVMSDKILEVACLVTDKELNLRNDGIEFAIRHPDEVYESMNEWCVEHHNKSGLVENCKKSKVTPELAENILLEYLKGTIPAGTCPLAGNSVYMDRLFLKLQLPAVDSYLHYRIIDVSTIKECVKRWNPKMFETMPKKKLKHRSLDDIKESIHELKFYREKIFNLSE